jgi:hypothetical protein
MSPETGSVLIDIPRLKGIEYLEPDTPIYPETWRLGKRKPAPRSFAAM